MMSDGCKGKAANDRSCYPKKAVDDILGKDISKKEAESSNEIKTRLSFSKANLFKLIRLPCLTTMLIELLLMVVVPY